MLENPIKVTSASWFPSLLKNNKAVLDPSHKDTIDLMGSVVLTGQITVPIALFFSKIWNLRLRLQTEPPTQVWTQPYMFSWCTPCVYCNFGRNVLFINKKTSINSWNSPWQWLKGDLWRPPIIIELAASTDSYCFTDLIAQHPWGSHICGDTPGASWWSPPSLGELVCPYIFPFHLEAYLGLLCIIWVMFFFYL